MGAQVEGEVEGRDAEDDALGETAGEGQAALAAGVGVEALGLAAVEAAGLLGGEAEHRHRAADLAAGPLDRLAVLGGDELCDLLGALGQALADVVEGGGAYVGGGGGELVPYGVCGGDGLFDLCLGRHADLPDDPAVPRRGHIEGGLTGGLAAGEPEGVGGSHVESRPFRG